jgi:hypothetical protein
MDTHADDPKRAPSRLPVVRDMWICGASQQMKFVSWRVSRIELADPFEYSHVGIIALHGKTKGQSNSHARRAPELSDV